MDATIVCDQLLERDDSTEIVEYLLDIFPDAEIITLAHRAGNILGPINQRKIRSSFLSKFCHDKESFLKWSALYPGACESIKLYSNSKLIYVGEGAAVGIGRKNKKMGYLLNNMFNDSITGVSRLFKGHTYKWFNTELSKFIKIFLNDLEIK